MFRFIKKKLEDNFIYHWIKLSSYAKVGKV